ncbi:hypothetical protein PIIN_06441 [Serendipita indica DSM 11827]|uniref:Uncharacterized protein n=1 Tax=Serendipita indica (strain DSM 11827) TaxID=1109443 RepID=G4TMG1_SERID|nr:hypothetical protein PIIN_06441 [Serendipita indica DSM 11827]
MRGPKGPNTGAIAGGVVASLVVVGLGFLYLWYRRRQAAAAQAAAYRMPKVEVKPDVVANPDLVLNRPDPLEKPPVQVVVQTEEVPMDPLYPPENPFSDHASIATASDRATNVIPIGIVTPSSASVALSHAESTQTAITPSSIATTTFSAQQASDSPYRQGPAGPIRPQRGPEIDMRLDLSRPTSELLLPPKIPYAPSSRSGASGVSGVSSRASTISTSSSFLNEAPQIVTPKQATFRQVLGVQKAEVVKLSSSPSSPTASLKSHLSTSTLGKPTRSPLSQQAFDAGDANGALDQGSVDPFVDQRDSDVMSTFSDMRSPVDWSSDRPMSAMSNAESIANIASAQRVQLVRPMARGVAETRALLAPPSPSTATPRAADFRSAGQLSPPAQAIPRSFDEDQRMSLSSVALTNRTSTTDSILEAFPFVPPSPISMHHSQPNTPMQRSFQQQQQAGPTHVPSDHRPGRATLGMSTASAVSSGLGQFPFQIDRASVSGSSDRDARASLDTVVLSRDVAEYPLPFAGPNTPTASHPDQKRG